MKHHRPGATMKIRCKFKLEMMVCSSMPSMVVAAARHFLLMAIVWCCCGTISWRYTANGSEFPERECCDPIYHPVPSVEPLPALSTTDTSLSSSMSGLGGVGGMTAIDRTGKTI